MLYTKPFQDASRVPAGIDSGKPESISQPLSHSRSNQSSPKPSGMTGVKLLHDKMTPFEASCGKHSTDLIRQPLTGC